MVKARHAIDAPVSTAEVDMRNPSTSELISLVRAQQAALHELIEIALTAVRESGDSSVSAIHLITRLNKLTNALRRSEGLLSMPAAAQEASRH
jgi:hypothetical protein